MVDFGTPASATGNLSNAGGCYPLSIKQLMKDLEADIKIMQMSDADFAELLHGGTLIDREECIDRAGLTALKLQNLLAGQDKIGTIHHWCSKVDAKFPEHKNMHFVSFQFTGGNSNWCASFPEAMWSILQRQRVQDVINKIFTTEDTANE